jgi:anti-anti-sigma factor
MLGILVHRNGNEVTLRCRGNVVAGRCVQVLRLAAEMRRERVVILDLCLVRALDAAGLGLLVDLHQSLESSGRELRLSRVSARVRRSIRLVRLDRVLNMENGTAMAA